MSNPADYRTTAGTVSFKIKFEYLTTLARQGWGEGRYQWAMDILESSGAPKESWADIIRGRSKMVTNLDESGSLAEDDWSPNLNMCSHGEYPDPDRLFELAERAVHWKRELWKRLHLEYRELEHQHRERSGRDLFSIAHQVRSFPEEFIQSLPDAERNLWYWAQGASLVETIPQDGILPKYALNPDAYIEHERELESRPTPDPMSPGEVETGWIDENGYVYSCGWNEHDWLAYRLGAGSTQNAEKLGWVLLGRAPVTQTLQVGHRRQLNDPEDDTPLTQRQIDALWDWCQANEVTLPDWVVVD